MPLSSLGHTTTPIPGDDPCNVSGRYALAPTFIVTVTRDSSGLVAQATGQPPFRLFAEGPRDFFLKVVDAQVTFEVDATGRATALVLHQNGAHPKGARVECGE